MAESNLHISYVKKIMNYVKTIVPKSLQILIDADLPYSTYRTPKGVNGYEPDVFYSYNSLLIIGEAKTDFDVDRPHSLNQYASYFKEACNFDGIAILIFCVSWKMSATIKNIMRRLKWKNNPQHIKIIVINDMEEIVEI